MTTFNLESKKLSLNSYIEGDTTHVPLNINQYLEIYDKTVIGGMLCDYVDGEFVFTEDTEGKLERAKVNIDQARLRLLSASDYIMMPDYPIDKALKARWKAYRQALRDIPNDPQYPYIDLPEQPPKKA